MNTPQLSPLARLNRLLARWGAHPDGRKHPAADTEITQLPLPPRLALPLAQHIGAPARPLVVAGQRVLRGELLAAAQGAISAPVHAPSSGVVLGIGDVPSAHPSGLAAPAIIIETDGKDEPLPLEEADPFALAPAEIAHRVAAAGIVGMGGAAFPSVVKLSLGQRQRIDVVVLNGGECEPYLSCDDRLMRERPESVVEGARILRHATGARVALIGVESNKPEAIAALRAAAAPFAELRVVAVPSRYPMGSEKQLIGWLTGREVPAQGRAADVGVVVYNVGTAAAVQRGVRYGEPLTRRVVTVAGGALRTPRNVEVRIGTPVSALIDFCGGLLAPAARFVMGGPMMGTALRSLDVPVVKGTSGVLALLESELGDAAIGPCIRCASCVAACPVGLVPLEMASRVRAGDLDGAQRLGLADCVGCGTCSYVCPSRIPLVQFFNHAKGELAARERERAKQGRIRALSQARALRDERESREKAEAAARRKAERERAKAAALAETPGAPAASGDHSPPNLPPASEAAAAPRERACAAAASPHEPPTAMAPAEPAAPAANAEEAAA